MLFGFWPLYNLGVFISCSAKTKEHDVAVKKRQADKPGAPCRGREKKDREATRYEERGFFFSGAIIKYLPYLLIKNH